MEELMEFMRGLDWSPLLISLKTGVVATILSFFGGIFAARQVIKAGPKNKSSIGWYSYTANGIAANGSRFFPFADF